MLGKFLSSGVAPSDALQMDGTSYSTFYFILTTYSSSHLCALLGPVGTYSLKLDHGRPSKETRQGPTGENPKLLFQTLVYS
jgi:hypothetical protein